MGCCQRAAPWLNRESFRKTGRERGRQKDREKEREGEKRRAKREGGELRKQIEYTNFLRNLPFFVGAAVSVS